MTIATNKIKWLRGHVRADFDAAKQRRNLHTWCCLHPEQKPVGENKSSPCRPITVLAVTTWHMCKWSFITKNAHPPLTTLSATEHTCTDYCNTFSIFSTKASPVYSNELEGVRFYNKENWKLSSCSLSQHLLWMWSFCCGAHKPVLSSPQLLLAGRSPDLAL